MECDYCKTVINGTYCLDSWGHKLHPEHINTAIKCGSCSNIVIPNALPKPKRLWDGRVICSNCVSDAILEDWQMMKCVQAVFNFYKLGQINFPENKISFKLKGALSMPGNLLGLYTFDGEAFKIKMLKGLNKTIFCSVLTHELMHVYIRLLGINFQIQEEEGLCEVARFFALKMFGTKHAQTRIENMETNNDVVYGDGFRMMKERVKQHGSIQKYLQTLKK